MRKRRKSLLQNTNNNERYLESTLNGKLPPKRVKLAAEAISQPQINMSIKQNIFQNKAKVTSVIPLDKGKSNKCMSHF